jgi:hypothetical protein
VDGAVVSATAASLARGLMLAAALMIVIAVVALLIDHGQAKRAARNGGGLARARIVLPWGGVVLGASAAAVVGGGIGAWAISAHGSILFGEDPLTALVSRLGVLSLASIAMGVTCAVLFTRHRTPRVAVSAVVVIAATGLFFTVSTTGELQHPRRSVEALVSVNDDVQGTIVVTPGAAGPNYMRMGLTGPDKNVEALRQSVATGNATVTLRSLTDAEISEPVVVQLDENGGLFATNIIAETDGRWRVQIDLADGMSFVVTDMTLQPNPLYQK